MEATERLTPHFTRSEMACRCCGSVVMDPDFMRRLEVLRVAYGSPMVMSSGFRCARYNQEVASSGPDGPHTRGQAVDVRVAGPRAYRLLHLALSYGMTGIGVKQHGPHESRFLHLDTVPRPYPIIWSYS